MVYMFETLLVDIQELLAGKRYGKLKEILSSVEAADIADLLYEFEPPTRVLLFRLLPKDLAIEVFELMEGQEREELLAHSTDEEVAELIEEMSDDDRTALFDELPAKTVKNFSRNCLLPKENWLIHSLITMKIQPERS